MPHERDLSDQQRDERWPVPYAITFMTVVSVGLWSLILTAANWLAG